MHKAAALRPRSTNVGNTSCHLVGGSGTLALMQMRLSSLIPCLPHYYLPLPTRQTSEQFPREYESRRATLTSADGPSETCNLKHSSEISAHLST